MAKHNSKGRSTNGPRHIRVHYWLMKSKAWESLKPGPRTLLIELYALYNGDNNGDLFLSEREAAKRCNISKATARKYFSELEERSFIRPKVKGSFNVKTPGATTWILSEFSYNGKAPTKGFMKWIPPQKQNTGLKFIPGGTKNYTRSPEKVVPIPFHGTKNYTR